MVKSNQMKMIWMTNGTTKKNLKKKFQKYLLFQNSFVYLHIFINNGEIHNTKNNEH
jgi:hypothetical protein